MTTASFDRRRVPIPPPGRHQAVALESCGPAHETAARLRLAAATRHLRRTISQERRPAAQANQSLPRPQTTIPDSWGVGQTSNTPAGFRRDSGHCAPHYNSAKTTQESHQGFLFNPFGARKRLTCYCLAERGAKLARSANIVRPSLSSFPWLGKLPEWSFPQNTSA